MNTEDMIPAHDFCIHHNVELAFIHSLNESGLIELIHVEQNIFLPISELNHVEKLVRFYHEMDINLEGIETINYLLQKMSTMQQDIARLQERLNLYENSNES